MGKKQPAAGDRSRTRKLQVERTTLRTLGTGDLEKVAGGTRNSGKLCGVLHPTERA